MDDELRKEGESRRRSAHHFVCWGLGWRSRRQRCSQLARFPLLVFFLLIIFSSPCFLNKKSSFCGRRSVRTEKTQEVPALRIPRPSRGGNGMCNMCLPPFSRRAWFHPTAPRKPRGAAIRKANIYSDHPSIHPGEMPYGKRNRFSRRSRP